MNTKYIFLDIDGTLVGYDSKIPDSALKALKLAQQNGHKVIIASGRSRSIIYPDLLKAVEFDGIIASGGACVICGEEVISRSVIKDEDLDRIVDYFNRKGIHFIVQATGGIYGNREFVDKVIPNMIKNGFSEELVKKTFMGVQIVQDVRSIPNIEKLTFYLSPYPPQKISDDNGGKYYVVDFSVGKISAPLYFGEMNMAGVNKATAIEKFMNYVGAPISDSIAFGDSGNDLEMMKFAGLSVAMGNATEPIKAVADYVTSDVEQDGIYNAFLHLGLI